MKMWQRKVVWWIVCFTLTPLFLVLFLLYSLVRIGGVQVQDAYGDWLLRFFKWWKPFDNWAGIKDEAV